MKKLLCILFIFLSAQMGFATNWYVRPNAYSSGTNAGTDWTNAWKGAGAIVWGGSGVNPGDTVYFGGGDYTAAMNITKGGSAGNITTLKRATVADHGTDTGWDAGLNAQVHFVGVGITMKKTVEGYQGYITIDGQVTDGWYMDFTGGETGTAINLTDTSQGSLGYITLRYLKIEGIIAGGTAYANSRAIHGNNARGLEKIPNLTIEYCNIGYWTPAMINLYYWSNVIIQNCNLYYAVSTLGGPHEDILMMYYSSNVTIRNNTIYGARVEGLYFETGVDGVYVYNNIFYQPAAYIGMGDAVASANADNITNLYVYNNVIDGYLIGVRHSDAGDTGSVQNNIFVNNATDYSLGASVTKDYNAFDGTTTETHGVGSVATSIFTDYAEHDYTLVAGTNAVVDVGATLGSPYNIDMLNYGRPFGAAYDIGPYERGGEADTTAPTLAEVTPVSTPSPNQAPSYVFSSDEAGTVTYGGTCGNGSLSTAIVGNNSTSWNLPVGTYSDCTVTVTDAALNASTPLAITEFVITPVISSASKVIEGGVTFMRLP